VTPRGERTVRHSVAHLYGDVQHYFYAAHDDGGVQRVETVATYIIPEVVHTVAQSQDSQHIPIGLSRASYPLLWLDS
jgi:hypothetical protein